MASGYPDFEGGKQRTYSVAEWAAVHGIEKTLVGVFALAVGGSDNESYTVPAGKTLYLTLAHVTGYGTLAADRDLNQICAVSVYDVAGGFTRYRNGGNGGAGGTMNLPVRIDAGEEVQIHGYNLSNHGMTVVVVAVGYEV